MKIALKKGILKMKKIVIKNADEKMTRCIRFAIRDNEDQWLKKYVEADRFCTPDPEKDWDDLPKPIEYYQSCLEARGKRFEALQRIRRKIELQVNPDLGEKVFDPANEFYKMKGKILDIELEFEDEKEARWVAVDLKRKAEAKKRTEIGTSLIIKIRSKKVRWRASEMQTL